MRLAIAQRNPVIGDVAGNLAIMKETLERVPEGAADLLVFPELFLCGYPPRDLLTMHWFVKRLDDALEEVLEMSKQRPNLGILFGTPRHNNGHYGKNLSNAAVLVENGRLLFEQHKQLLPTYDVFDELRYFDPGSRDRYTTFDYKGESLGISICEDAWNDGEFEEVLKYDHNPIEDLARRGATLMINITASPFHLNKDLNRFERNRFHARKWKVPFVSVAQVGANDELIFDGRSIALDGEGRILASLKAYEEELKIVDTAAEGNGNGYQAMEEMESLRQALVLGVRDYMLKCGFHRVVLGLSGGIDSAVVACLAADAVGPKNVRAITMPSHVSSSGSVDDSLELATNLGIQCDTLPIRDIYSCFTNTLSEPFKGLKPDVTEENLQARIRGTLLMAYSNKFGALLLSTGNKSELAMGYCTLYGDMDGGLAVISDLPKTTVYNLARWYNREKEVVPEAILTKPPSAELSEGQTDQDTLPAYEILDPILVRYLEQGLGADEIIAQGYDEEVVRWVIRTVERNEYKRWQAAPGLRVSPKSFGAGRRMPIAARRS